MEHSARTKWSDGSRIRLFMATLLAIGMCALLPITAGACSYDELSRLKAFDDYGTANPGNLRAYYYLPDGLPPNPPLVVALHGCGQKACDYDDETGWIALAKQYKFALLFPEQQDMEGHFYWFYQTFTGNPGRCFSWWLTSETDPEGGEPKSIMNMIRRMVEDFRVDPLRIYITGLSAGGAMTVTMLGHHPECFAGGAPMAGVPFDCAGPEPKHTVAEECMCLDVEGVRVFPEVLKGMDKWIPALEPRKQDYAARRAQCVRMEEPIEKRIDPKWKWGDLVRVGKNSDTKWPRISIWQGANDPVVAPVNMKRLMLQWTDLHGLDPAKGTAVHAPAASPYQIEHTTYADKSGRTLVETYLVKSEVPGHSLEKVPATGHATAVDPPSCGCASVDCACELENVCTKDNETGYIKDAGICSSLRVVQFWGLDRPTTAPSGISPSERRCKALESKR